MGINILGIDCYYTQSILIPIKKSLRRRFASSVIIHFEGEALVSCIKIFSATYATQTCGFCFGYNYQVHECKGLSRELFF